MIGSPAGAERGSFSAVGLFEVDIGGLSISPDEGDAPRAAHGNRPLVGPPLPLVKLIARLIEHPQILRRVQRLQPGQAALLQLDIDPARGARLEQLPQRLAFPTPDHLASPIYECKCTLLGDICQPLGDSKSKKNCPDQSKFFFRSY